MDTVGVIEINTKLSKRDKPLGFKDDVPLKNLFVLIGKKTEEPKERGISTIHSKLEVH